MKKIFINGRFLSQRITGVQRYAREVLATLDIILKENEFSSFEIILLIPKKIKFNQNYQNIKIKKIGFWNGHFWEQLFLPLYTFRKTLLNLCNTGPILKKRQAVVIHDTAVFANPDNFSFLFRNYYKFLLKIISKFSLKIITVSDFSKEEIIKYLKVPRKKIVKIYEGHEHILRVSSEPNTLHKFGLTPNNYFLAVSSLNKNKNMKSIIKAFQTAELSEYTLALAGAPNSRIFGKETYPNITNVKYLGYVTDGELKCLYENALAFVFPSFYEGFGLPVLEAMACGCPVITSNTTSMPEITQKAAFYCDPNQIDSIKSVMKLLSSNEKKRVELSLLGKNQSELFLWKNTANNILNIFNTKLEKNNKCKQVN